MSARRRWLRLSTWSLAGSGIGAAALLSASVADAAALKNKRIGNWLAGAYSDDTTGVFNHCAAASSYRSGVSLVFAINKSFAWSVGLGNMKWNLSKGDKYQVSLRVDNAPPLAETAVAVTPNLAEVQLADSTALFDAFRHGNLLTVYAAGQTFKFDLTSTSTLLPALLDCVKSYNDKAAPPSSANPFVTRGKPAKKPGEIDVKAAPDRRTSDA